MYIHDRICIDVDDDLWCRSFYKLVIVHPVIQVPNQLVGAPLGTDVQIECHVEASPKSINYWIKDTGKFVTYNILYVHIYTYTQASHKHTEWRNGDDVSMDTYNTYQYQWRSAFWHPLSVPIFCYYHYYYTTTTTILPHHTIL